MAETIIPQSELARRSELRLHALVPLYVFWASNVPHDLALAGQQGVVDALVASGQDRKIAVYGATTYSNGPYGGSDWYVHEALKNQQLDRNIGFGQQLDVDEVMKLFLHEPWQEQPHWEVFIVNHDLNGRGRDGRYINFCYGTTYPTFPASVQSVRRVEAQVEDPNLQKAMVRRLLRHEVGHMFRLNERGEHVEEKLGRHCTNICTMRQGLTIEEWAQHTIEEEQAGIHFCAECMDELAQSRTQYRPLNG